MKTFFGKVFIDKKTLKTSGINHPIKLEYYKNINTQNKEKAKYGVSIIKTEYENQNKKIEKQEIQYLTNDEKRVDYILKILRENSVTPVGLKDVVTDFAKQIL